MTRSEHRQVVLPRYERLDQLIENLDDEMDRLEAFMKRNKTIDLQVVADDERNRNAPEDQH